MSFKEYERMSNKNTTTKQKLLHKKILIIGAAYTLPVQEISIRF